MATQRLKLMYWPNEPTRLLPNGLQVGGRTAFSGMAADGTIGALSIFSFLAERDKYQLPQDFELAATSAIRDFKPDILFVQHLFGTDITENFWRHIREEHPRTTIVYHEGDPFDRRVKRVDRATIGILRHAHLILCCGLGSLADILGRYGKGALAWMPHCVVAESFARLVPHEAKKQFDLVMIGNRGNRRRLKALYVPGGRKRADFAERLSTLYGRRFALYGNGWSNLRSSKGLLPFSEQERAIQSARVTVNWDHFDDIDYYFSDRLPISLAGGVPHVTSYHSGYENIFAGCPGLYPCRTVDEAVETIKWLLSRSDAELVSEGSAARQWILERFESTLVFRTAFEQALRVRLDDSELDGGVLT